MTSLQSHQKQVLLGNILILYNKPEGERKEEHMDTLVQVKEISDALKKLKHNVTTGAIGNSLGDIENLIKKHKPSLVFNLVESFCGSDLNIHLIPAYLESLGIAYTGCSSESIFLTGNKIVAKKIMSGSEIPTPYYFDDSSECLPAFSSEQFIVKSVTEDASFGLDLNSVVTGSIAARNLILKKTSELGGKWMAEQYIDGREFHVSIIGRSKNPKILPIAEMRFDKFADDLPKIVDYAAKWDEQSYTYDALERQFIDEDAERILVTKVQDITLKCWDAFDIYGYARIDFRIDNEGNPFVLEINTNPCITSHCTIIAAAEKTGMTYLDTISQIMEIVNNDHFTEDTQTIVA